MKKTYQNPTLKVVNVTVQHLMAGSVQETAGTVNSVSLGGDFSGEASDVMDKDGESLWED